MQLVTTCPLQVDVYSFGMILYQLMEQQAPFAELGAAEAARQTALHNKRPQFVLSNNAAFKMVRPSTHAMLYRRHKCPCADGISAVAALGGKVPLSPKLPAPCVYIWTHFQRIH